MGPGPESHPVPKTNRRRTGVRTMQGMNCLPSGPMLLDQDGLLYVYVYLFVYTYEMLLC